MAAPSASVVLRLNVVRSTIRRPDPMFWMPAPLWGAKLPDTVESATWIVPAVSNSPLFVIALAWGS